MHVQYGNYTHGAFEATLRVVPEITHSEVGTRISARLQFMVDGKLTAATNSDLLQQIRTLETAYSQDRKDLRLLYPAPSSLVALHYKSAEALTGIVVKRPPTSVGFFGAEWACEWNYSIILEATYVNEYLQGTFVVGFNAGLRRQGNGGPGFDLVPAKEGKWRKQITTQTTPVRLWQFGQLTGLKQYPRNQVPKPLFPNDLVSESDNYEEVAAAANQQTEFTINYGYEFWRNGPFF